MLAAFDVRWWIFLHLLGVFGFLLAHGISVGVALRLRTERDRARIAELMRFSGSALSWMYGSIGLLLIGGIAAGLQIHAFGFWWIWISLGLLVALVAEMSAVARPYYQRVKESIEVRASGVPRKSDEELDALLRSPVAVVNMAIGFAALAVILWLMIWQPLWHV